MSNDLGLGCCDCELRLGRFLYKALGTRRKNLRIPAIPYRPTPSDCFLFFPLKAANIRLTLNQ